MSPISSYVTIIVALLTIFGGMLTYTYQRRNDRKNQLIEIRRAAYRGYLAALMDQIQRPTADTSQQLLKCEIDLLAVASDATIKKVGEFSSYMISTSFENKHTRDKTLHKMQLAEVILAMRHDCFEKSKLSGEEALKLLPME